MEQNCEIKKKLFQNTFIPVLVSGAAKTFVRKSFA